MKKFIKEYSEKEIIRLKNFAKCNIGKKYSKERCLKISEGRKGIKFSKKHIKALVKSHLGKVMPETQKKKISVSMMGKKKTKESIIKQIISCKGFRHTKESCRKIGEASRNNLLKKIKIVYGSVRPFFNLTACKFFTKINKLYNLKGRYAKTNGGEYHIKGLGYFVDYYESELNLVIEWNEKQHYEMNIVTGRYILTNAHKSRQSQIKRKLGCTFINIDQRNFNEQKVFEKIENIIRQKRIKLVS